MRFLWQLPSVLPESPLLDATLIAVIDHLIKNLVTLAGGIVSIYYFGDWVIPSIRTVLDAKLGEDTPDR